MREVDYLSLAKKIRRKREFFSLTSPRKKERGKEGGKKLSPRSSISRGEKKEGHPTTLYSIEKEGNSLLFRGGREETTYCRAYWLIGKKGGVSNEPARSQGKKEFPFP